MTSLLVMKEHLKAFYAKYNIVIQPILRFILGMCAFYCLNTNIGYMTRLKNPLVPLLLSLAGALLPYGAIVFFAGCFMIAHIYAVSFEMALIALVLILIVAILYFGFRPGDCFLMLLTPMAFMMKIPYAVPLLVGLGGSLASVIPVGCGVFIYYLIMYVKQNAGVLTNDTSVDIVQKYSQIIKSVTFNKTMMVMIATCAAGILVVYLIRRLSLNYAWSIAIVAGCVAQLLVIFAGDFVFGVSVPTGQLLAGMTASALLALVYDFFIFSVDNSRTEYVQFEDDDYYYYVKAVPKMTVSTPDVKVQKISTRKRSGRERA